MFSYMQSTWESLIDALPPAISCLVLKASIKPVKESATVIFVMVFDSFWRVGWASWISATNHLLLVGVLSFFVWYGKIHSLNELFYLVPTRPACIEEFIQDNWGNAPEFTHNLALTFGALPLVPWLNSFMPASPGRWAIPLEVQAFFLKNLEN